MELSLLYRCWGDSGRGLGRGGLRRKWRGASWLRGECSSALPDPLGESPASRGPMRYQVPGPPARELRPTQQLGTAPTLQDLCPLLAVNLRGTEAAELAPCTRCAYNRRMDTLSRAHRAIQEAERQLRSLLEKAVQAGDYDVVVPLTELAKSLSLLIVRTSTNPSGQDSPGPQPKERGAVSAKTAPRSYPHFRRDKNTLVKVGWSKSSRTEYEHKAPRQVLDLLARRLQRNFPSGTVFAMSEVLPLRANNGNEVPDYQTYLCLAWLRQQDLVEKRGRDGYALTEAFSADRIGDLWKDLEARGG